MTNTVKEASMTKSQWAAIFTALVLVLAMYFGCDRVPSAQKTLEKNRVLSSKSTNLEALLLEAKSILPAEGANAILALENQLESTASDEFLKVEVLKDLSGEWFDLGQAAIAGAYARQVAEILGTEESWSIAGTTFAIGIQRNSETKVRDFCREQAVEAFENAISLNPENLDHKVNLALCYVENPLEAEPMKGIQMLIGPEPAAP